MLPWDVKTSLWTPMVAFVNTDGNHHTLMDEDVVMWITQRDDPIRRDDSMPAEGRRRREDWEGIFVYAR